jgi:hypothetical protein
MFTLSEYSTGIVAVIIVIYIGVFICAFYYDKNKEKDIRSSSESIEKYKKFAAELSDDMHKYNIGKLDQQSIENVVHEILKKKANEKSLFWRLVNSGKSGILLGGLSGALMHGPAGAFTTGIVAGLVNPVVIMLNEFSMVSEELVAAQEARDKETIRQILKL